MTDQTPIEPTEKQIDAAAEAFYKKLSESGLGTWTSPADWREEVTEALRAGMNA